MPNAALRAVRALALPDALHRALLKNGTNMELLMLALMLCRLPSAAALTEFPALPLPEELLFSIEEVRHV